MNNEFGEDFNCSLLKDKEKSKGRDGWNWFFYKFIIMVVGVCNDWSF